MTALATTEPAFYDAAMTDADELAMLPLEASPWRDLYAQAASLVAPGAPVVDLGCGTGRFAEQLRRAGQRRYTGIDFSPAAIAECKRYVPELDEQWEADFRVVDLRSWGPGERSGSTVYTCLETLEHLEDDINLVERIPVGHELVFSVPNYGGVAHLRYFQNVSDAWHRYGHLLEFRAWIRIGDGPRNFVHLYRAARRGDAWV